MDANVHNIRPSMSKLKIPSFYDEMKLFRSSPSSLWNHNSFLLSRFINIFSKSCWPDLQSALTLDQAKSYDTSVDQKKTKGDQFMASEILCKEGRQCRPLFIGCVLVPLVPPLLCLWSFSCLMTWTSEQAKIICYNS